MRVRVARGEDRLRRPSAHLPVHTVGISTCPAPAGRLLGLHRAAPSAPLDKRGALFTSHADYGPAVGRMSNAGWPPQPPNAGGSRVSIAWGAARRPCGRGDPPGRPPSAATT